MPQRYRGPAASGAHGVPRLRDAAVSSPNARRPMGRAMGFRFDGAAQAARRLLPLALIGALAGLFALTIAGEHGGVYWALDFDGTVWHAGATILDGRSPYPAPDPATLAAILNPAVYPAGVLVALSPLSLLPFD